MPDLKNIAQEFQTIKNYDSVEYVGQGAFKQTFRLRAPDGVTVALKIYDPLKYDAMRTVEEINAVLKCNSKYIGKLFDFGWFKCKNNKYFFTLDEYFDGGTLTDRMKSNGINGDFVKHCAVILVKALRELKEQKLVHRDIKPDNIMLNETAPR